MLAMTLFICLPPVRYMWNLAMSYELINGIEGKIVMTVMTFREVDMLIDPLVC